MCEHGAHKLYKDKNRALSSCVNEEAKTMKQFQKKCDDDVALLTEKQIMKSKETISTGSWNYTVKTQAQRYKGSRGSSPKIDLFE